MSIYLLASVALLAWLYLLLGRDGFWRARPRIEDQRDGVPPSWPEVVAVVPARNEADHVGCALNSLLEQDYAGRLTLVLVDDYSEDATRAIGERLRAAALPGRRLEVVPRALCRRAGPASSGRWRRACAGPGIWRPEPATCCSPTPTSGTIRTISRASSPRPRRAEWIWSR